MSTSYTVDIHCDRCANWTYGATGPKPQGLATKAVKAAKKLGWSRCTKSIYTDLCPNCLKEVQKGAA